MNNSQMQGPSGKRVLGLFKLFWWGLTAQRLNVVRHYREKGQAAAVEDLC